MDAVNNTKRICRFQTQECRMAYSARNDYTCGLGISYMGRNTINVYFWHWPLIMGADTLLKFGNLCNNDIRKMIFMATSVMLTVVLSTKIFEFPMKQLREAIDRKSTA